jgi:prephenate dehydratase
MFFLITPSAITSMDRTESRFLFNEMEEKRSYSTIEDAIDAAIEAGLDLGIAVIEKNGVRGSVNDWIACRIAGGLCGVG